MRVGNKPRNLEKSRSWPSAHDWKSCIPQKGIEGSNPSFSAKIPNAYAFGIFFFFPFHDFPIPIELKMEGDYDRAHPFFKNIQENTCRTLLLLSLLCDNSSRFYTKYLL